MNTLKYYIFHNNTLSENMGENRELDKIYRKVDRAFREFLIERSEIIHVEQIMNRQVITINQNASMLQAAKTMGEHNIGSLVVINEKKAWGFVIDSEIINLLAKEIDLRTVQVKDALSTPLINISSNASIAEAATMMIQSESGLVIFEKGMLVGVVSPSDVIKSLPDCPETNLLIDDFMSNTIISLNESASALEAIKVMSANNIGSIIVTKKEKPHSIFTDGDLLSNYFTNGKALSEPIQKAGSSPLHTVPAGTTVHKTAYIMSKNQVKRLPVTKNNELIGIITARDLIRAYTIYKE
jgi:CBS domain-containing protein